MNTITININNIKDIKPSDNNNLILLLGDDVEINISQQAVEKIMFYNKQYNNTNEFDKLANKSIGVVSKDVDDFHLWRVENSLELDNEFLSGVRRFRSGDDMYYCADNIRRLKGHSFDEVVETDNAHTNPEYKHIINLIRTQLKTNGLWLINKK